MGTSISKEDFIKRSSESHTIKYIYTYGDYINLSNKVTITCPVHGNFRQSAKNHLYGANCPKCGCIARGRSNKKSQNSFINRSKTVHNNKYTYENSIYTGKENKIAITCNEHGSFWQRAGDHIRGSGCPLCADRRKRAKYLNEPTFLYYIYFPDTNVYKIGITLVSIGVKNRFRKESIKFDIIKQAYYQSGLEAYTVEQFVLSTFSPNKYLGPPILESGNSELFDTDILNLHIKEVNDKDV